MVMANGVKFTIHNSSRIGKGHLILAHGSKVGILYPLYVSNKNNVLSITELPTVALWHSRLGQMSKKGMETLSRLGYLPSLSFFDFPFCERCQYGKQARAHCTHSFDKERKPLELVHSNLCGPMPSKYHGGASYYVTFIDDATRHVSIYAMKFKDETFPCFKKFLSSVETQSQHKLKALRSENGGEYVSKEFADFFSSRGIKCGLLHPLEIPQGNWESISMDFIVGLPTIARGHDSVWVVIKYADEKLRQVVFKEGDYVFLRIPKHSTKSLKTGPTPKLSPRICGPFKILGRVGFMAYNLDLTANSHVHPIFHVSRLRQRLLRKDNIIDQEVLVDFIEPLNLPHEPKQILDSHDLCTRHHVRHQVLVKWKDRPEEGATSKNVSTLRKRFPSFIFENKNASPRRGKIMAAASIFGVQFSLSLPTQKCGLPVLRPLHRPARLFIIRNFITKVSPAAWSCLHLNSRSYGVAAHISGETRIDPIVSTDWLSRRLGDVCILDVRGFVVTRVVEHGVEKSDYLASYDDYLEGHIPGAVFFNWVKDGVVDDSDIPVQMTTDTEEFAMLMEAKGVSTEKPAVVYDCGDGLLAPRVWWALVMHGHPSVFVLDGGWKKWLEEDREMESTAQCPLKIYTKFEPRKLDFIPRITAMELLDLISKEQAHGAEAPGEANVRIIDARSQGQYSGFVRRSKHGGRIPGAVNIPRKVRVDEIRAVWNIRWDWFHKPIHAVAHILHPLWRNDEQYSNEELEEGFMEYMRRVTGDNVDTMRRIEDDLLAFRNHSLHFGRATARLQETQLQPVSWWKKYGNCAPTLKRFAIRVLSQDCSSVLSLEPSQVNVDKIDIEKVRDIPEIPLEERDIYSMLYEELTAPVHETRAQRSRARGTRATQVEAEPEASSSSSQSEEQPSDDEIEHASSDDA
ncbi:hypothetical protein L7F22_026287 [Adiantum nelumboides]|nr:hypothetical protein [Adiantum nelumboides]